MILACPECSTRFVLDPAQLGVDGRRVRCARCSHIWFQAPDEPADAVPEEPVAPVDFGEIRRRQARSADEPPPFPQRSGLPALPDEGGDRQALGWSALGAVLIVLVGVGFFARAEITAAWPPAKRLYAALGLAGEQLGAGLEVRNIKSRQAKENGVPVLVIEGEIANVSDMIRDVPGFRAALYDKGTELQHWRFRASEKRLLPGETATFTTRVERPDKTATDFDIKFVEPEPAGG